MQSVTVFGCGTIGASWAGLFAARGLSVKLYDLRPEAARSALAKAREIRDWLGAKGLAPAGLAAPDAELRACADPREALEDAEFIQESVLERYAIKREAHQAIDRYAPPDALLASSTSGLLASRMQEGLERPERFLIAHPFNPPHLIPLVELVAGPRTAPEAVERARAFYAELGKTPIVLKKEVPGHVANRLAVALWREAIHLVAEGVADLEDVDRAVCAGLGQRWTFMGPHLTYHLAGGAGGYPYFFEHLAGQLEVYMRDLAEWTEIPEQAKDEVLRQMQAALKGRDVERLNRDRDETLAGLQRALAQANPHR
ncbi:MAG: 3-hydroxyacyl-CoA dehydrogenase NAD-binding domain-containing protein [Planctomycetota bacterium]|nr:3-hydroxyacyl-CoA dehydrogenase NAD-binding domain-containing protein [Planctomycetota bacterium]